jgi:adenylyl cyclase-associated protein
MARLAVLESQAGIQPTTTTKATSKAPVEVPRIVRLFEQHYQEHVVPFLAVCQKLGEHTVALGNIIDRVWAAQKNIIFLASKSKKPADNDLRTVVQPLNDMIQECQKLIQRGDWENHQRAVYGGLGCVSWVTVTPAPTDFIENFIGESDFYSNKIRVQFKGKNEDQIAFCNTFKEIIRGLMAYVKEHHTTGLSWNPRGVDFSPSLLQEESESKEQVPSTTTQSAPQPTSQSTAAPLGALFSSLNKGSDVTSGLKKVTKDQQTWRAEYKASDGSTSAPQPQPQPQSQPRATAPTTSKVRGPPVVEFNEVASKWIINNQTKEQGVVEINADNVKHMVYIYGCDDATISISGKFKSVTIDSCNKTRVLFDTVISSCELVNCKRMQIQVRGTVPSIAIDKTDGCQTYLSKESLSTNFVTSKSSEMNISFPNENDDMVEVPIPEQFVHRLIHTPGSKPSVSSNVSDLYA